MNTQKPEKSISARTLGSVLDVHSIFPTVQGEGPFTGQRATFIRLAGCNLQCPACDTEYTSGRQLMNLQTIMKQVNSFKASLVVITGGEPFRQDIEPLVGELLRLGYIVQVETNGTLAPRSPTFNDLCSLNTNTFNRCFVVCSPKTGKVAKGLRPIICAYKYVMAADSMLDDGLPMLALDHSSHPFVARPHAGFRGPVYLQPCDDKDASINARNLEACVASVLEHGYTLQLQTHKLINVE